MRDNNTMNRYEFIIEHIICTVTSMIWYKNILFRFIDNYSFSRSKMILWGLIFTISLIGICFEMKRKRNRFSVFMNLVTAYGFYTIFAYLQIRKSLIIVVLAVSAALSVVYTVFIMSRQIKNRHKLKKIIRNQVIKSASVVCTLFAFGFALIMAVSGVNILLGSTIINASVDTPTASNINEQTIANNMDTIILLKEENWKNLTVNERLDVLQTAANIEQRYLGLPNELNVGAANLWEGLEGYYYDTTHEIVINMDSLLNESSWKLLDIVCHEAFHSYQHRLVEVYNKADKNNRNLRILRKSASYAEEFSNYIRGEEDFYSYYYQKCESDARDYAKEAVYDYYQRIYENF